MTPQFKSQLLPSHCSSILKLRFCITFENLFINYLKPCQNKKGQSFVVMLGFCMSFFLICISCLLQKRHEKPSITTNVWSFLFCQSFSSKIKQSDQICEIVAFILTEGMYSYIYLYLLMKVSKYKPRFLVCFYQQLQFSLIHPFEKR